MLASLCQTPRPGTVLSESKHSSFSGRTHAAFQDDAYTGLSRSLCEVLFWRCTSNGMC